MLLPQTPPFRKRAGKPLRPPKPAPPAPPVLVAAAQESDPVTGDWLLRLTFDRAVDASGLAPAQVTMDDAAGTGWVFVATGVASTPDPQTLVLALAQTDVPAHDDASFTATPANGIVAADDGAAWAGVVECVLPYP
jgi:hypothetical protein